MMITGPSDLVLAELYAGFVDVVLVKGTAIVSVAALACWLSRRSSASIRHAIWAAAFLVLVALPVLRLGSPADGLTIVGATSPSIVVGQPIATRLAAVSPVASARPSPALESRPAAAPATTRTPLATIGVHGFFRWVVAVWLAGLAIHVLRFGVHLAVVRRLRARSSPAPAAVSERTGRLAAEIGLRRVPSTLISPDIGVPSAFGVARPTIVLPRDAGAWSDERLEAAILHELVHLRRGDYALHVIATLTEAAYWVNPAVRYAARRLDRERERACDDRVVGGRVDPIRYAEYLVSLAWSGRDPGAQPMLSLASRSSLGERVRSLLDRAQARAPLGQRMRVAIFGGAAAVVALAGAIEIFGIVPSPQVQAGALSDPDPLVRRHAAWALGEAESAEHVDALIGHLTDPDPRVRMVSAWALGEIKDPRAIEPLVARLSDDDPRVREMAVLAIGEIEHPAGLAALRAADPSAGSAEARAWAIAQIEHSSDGPEVFAGALAGPDVRFSDPSAHLPDLGAPDPRVRARAAEALGLLGSTEAVDALLDALEDDDPAVRAAAVWALDEINPSRSATPRGPVEAGSARPRSALDGT